jgi:hypothetical protein
MANQTKWWDFCFAGCRLQARRVTVISHRQSGWAAHMWTAPIGKPFFEALNELVGFGHMSGLLVRDYDRWP